MLLGKGWLFQRLTASFRCGGGLAALLKRADPKHAVKKQLVESEEGLMRDKMLPRKQQRLYEAMQIGKARKQARVDELKERKQIVVDKKNNKKK